MVLVGSVLEQCWFTVGTKVSGETVILMSCQVLCSIDQCCAVLCSIVQCCVVLCSVMQVRLLKLESEVERERKKLAELRRRHYHDGGGAEQ